MAALRSGSTSMRRWLSTSMTTVAYRCRRASADIINTKHCGGFHRGLRERVDQPEHGAAAGRHPESTGKSSPSPAR